MWEQIKDGAFFNPLWFLFPGFFFFWEQAIFGLSSQIGPYSGTLLLHWNHPHQDFGICSITSIINAYELMKEIVMAKHSLTGLGCG